MRESTVKAEYADLPRDGKQIRVIRTYESMWAPEDDVELCTVDIDDARGLRDSLTEIIKQYE